MRQIFSDANHMKFFLMIFPIISLHCTFVPVQHREYEKSLFPFSFCVILHPYCQVSTEIPWFVLINLTNLQIYTLYFIEQISGIFTHPV